jgi:hypothetical protein
MREKMIEPRVPPERVPIQPPVEEQAGSQHSRTHDISDFRWPRIIGVIIVFMLVGFIGWIVISDGGMFISKLATHITRLFDRSTIDPRNSTGFTSFVQLILAAGFVALILYIIRKK